MEKVCGIYKIQCKNKIYIGSSKNIHVRLTNHKRLLKSGKHENILLQRAWNKYGEKFFRFEAISLCEQDELLVREQEQIDFWRPTGYLFNIKMDADNLPPVIRSPVCCFDKDGSLLNSFDSIEDASIFYDIKGPSITAACKYIIRTAGGLFWSYTGNSPIIRPKKKYKRSNCRAVCSYNKHGDLLRKFLSIAEASRFYGINNSSILNACKGTNKSSGGYYWSYENERVIIVESKKTGSKGKPVSCYDKKGELVKTFDSAAEAARFYGISSTPILNACKHVIKSCKGFYWARGNNKPLIRPMSHNKPVCCYKNDYLVGEFDSIKYAAIFLGIKRCHIGEVCDGKRKSTHGYTWKYA